tara:strand:- start:636 stop:812 length:177 start_codon:yes stop_codon:yes gene_type:complete
MSVEEIITDEECPLCGEHLTIIKNKNQRTKLCGLSESCGYILPLGNAVDWGFKVKKNE